MTYSVLEPFGGPWLLLGLVICFLAVNYALSAVFAKNMNATKSQFLVASRDLNQWQASLSIAASYLWAPAFFITATLGYTRGWQGVMYFLLGNGLALCIFGLMVNRICKRWSSEFTISDFFGHQYGVRVQSLYWIGAIGLMIGAFSTQLYAGAKLMAILSGIDYTVATVLLALVPLCYSVIFGFKSSVINGFAKMFLCLSISMILAILTVQQAGLDTIVQGMTSVTGDHGNLFSLQGWNVFATFGLATLLGLLSGPFGDQSLWQRAFATPDADARRKGFIWAAGLFLIVPVCMAIIGFAAAGQGLPIQDHGFVNVEYIVTFFPVGITIFFALMVLAGVTMDSQLSAMSSVAGHDFAKRVWNKPTDKQSIMLGRISMIVLTVVAVLVANIPGITLIHLFLIYNTLRASTCIPTIIFMITHKPMHEGGVFWGILTSMILGLPILIYGAIESDPWATVGGCLLSVGLSGIISVMTTVIKSKEKSDHQ